MNYSGQPPPESDPAMTFNMQRWMDSAARVKGLTLRETRVLWLMARYADYDTGGGIYPSTKTIAEELDIEVARLRGTKGAIGVLVAHGWLVVVRPARQHSPAEYRLAVGVDASGASPKGAAAGGGVGHAPTPEVAKPAMSESTTPEVRHGQNGHVQSDAQTWPNWHPRHGQTGTPDMAKLATQTTQEQLNHHLSDQLTSRATAHEPASPHDARRADDPTTVQGVVIDTPQTGTDLATQATRTIQDAKQLSEELAKRLRSRGMANVAADRKSAAAMTALLNNGATPEQISHVIRWVTTEDTSFWAKQVVNAATFCKHYDQIVAEARHAISRRNAEQDGRTARQRASDEQSARWRAMPEPEPKAIERPKTGEEQLAALLAAKQTA